MAIIQHIFYKDQSKKTQEVINEAFKDLKPISEMKPNKFELPIYTLKRILGDKFYDLSESEDDVLAVSIESEGNFDEKSLGINLETSRNLLNFIQCVFQGFMEICPKRDLPIPQDFAKNQKVRMAVTTTDGVISNMVTMDDFKDLWRYDSKTNDIVGLTKDVEIQEYVTNIQKNNMAIQKLSSTGSNETVQKLTEESNEYSKKILDIYREIISNYFKNTLRLTQLENVDNVYDIAFIFSRELVDETGKVGNLKETDIIVYHDSALFEKINLKNKFAI